MAKPSSAFLNKKQEEQYFKGFLETNTGAKLFLAYRIGKMHQL